MEQQFQFGSAARRARRLRLNLEGPSGAGKTWTACALAETLGERRFIVDTEHGSALLYDEEFPWASENYLELVNHHPQSYVNAILAAEKAGADVIILDSLTHAWTGTDGALSLHDKASKYSGNSYTAWRDVTPLHNMLVETILGSKAHIITTLRTKTEYVLETNERGKQVPRKVGMAPIFREGVEYEFTVNITLDRDHNGVASKTRIPALDGVTLVKPGRELGRLIRAWAEKRGAIELPPAIVATEAVASERGEEPPAPAEAPVPPRDEAFLEAVFRQYDRIGKEAYDEVVARFGGDATLITDPKQKRDFYGLLQARAPKPAAKADSLVAQLEKENQ